MNLIIRANLLVVFLLDALLDVPEWGFDPDSFCCLEWSWVLRVLWDMVLYPWCGLVGFFPTFFNQTGDLFLLCQKTILNFKLKVGYKLISIFKTIMGLSTKDVSTFFQFFDTPPSPCGQFLTSVCRQNSILPPPNCLRLLLTTPSAWSISLKTRSEKILYWFCRFSILLGLIMSKKQERLRSELLSEDKITNLLVFLTW